MQKMRLYLLSMLMLFVLFSANTFILSVSANEVNNFEITLPFTEMYDFDELTETQQQQLVQQHIIEAEQGNAVAQANLGWMYIFGNGVEQNYEEAAHWNRLAAEQGNARAQVNLGLMYDLGDGV